MYEEVLEVVVEPVFVTVKSRKRLVQIVVG